MKRRFALIFVYAAVCVGGLWFSSTDLWVGLWLAQLIYVFTPLLLLSIFDAIVRKRRALSERSRFRLLLHICAAFAFGLGYAVYRMSVASDHPMVDMHAWLPLVFAALVYALPVSMWFRTILVSAFFRGVTTTDSLSNKSLQKTVDPAVNSAAAESPSASTAAEHRR